MKEKLLPLGWIMFYECRSCGHKQYFHHVDKPGYQIRGKLNSNTCSILLNNLVVDGPFWIYDLENKLAKHGL